MASARLLLAVLLFCSLSAFTQAQQAESSPSPGNIPRMPKVETAQAISSEPSRIASKLQSSPELNPEWLQDPRANHKIRYEGYEIVQGKGVTRYLLPDSQTGPAEGKLCYTIRGYMVARDEKDSDSTHPVRSSTCQPADRFHVKSAESRRDSADR